MLSTVSVRATILVDLTFSLDPLAEVTNEMQCEWYSLSVELEITHKDREVRMVADHL